jgi:membrane fusion protein (multidrug efflux system)
MKLSEKSFLSCCFPKQALTNCRLFHQKNIRMKQISIFIAVVLIALSSSCSHEDIAVHAEGHAHGHPEGMVFKVTTPLKKDTMIYKEYVCQLRSIQHIELRALEEGYLQNIFVDEGQLVRKGQRLFKIVPNIYEAEVQKAQAEVSFAEIEYQNTKILADSNIVAAAELALVKAKLDKAKAELALAETHLGFTEIKAPFSGIVGRFHETRLGSLLENGELLTTLSDNSKIWCYFNVPEAEYLNYTYNSSIKDLPSVSLQMANKQMFEEKGVIETIEADFNSNTGNIAFRATFSNPKGILRHGQTGNVLLPVVLKEAILIPQKATFEILDKKYVYVVNDKGEIESREIVVGSEIPHLYEVVKGLDLKDKILLEGLRKVENGDKIKSHFLAAEEVMNNLELYAE